MAKNKETTGGMFKALRNLFVRKDYPKLTTEKFPKELLGRASGSFRQWFDDLFRLIETRQDKYDKYDYLDKNLPEAEVALSVYGDNIVSGSIGGEETYKVMVDENHPEIDRVEEIVENLETRIRLKDDIWDIARDFVKYADVFEEVVLANKEGNYYIYKLKDLPEKQMWVDVDEYGRLKDPAKPYIQRTSSYDKEGIPFAWWQVIHFKQGRRTYGVDRSLFANSSNRVGRQLIWIYESMVIARITRAWQRYAYLIDTTNLPEDAKFDYVDRFMERVKRKEVVDRETGRINVSDAPPLPDDDLGIPVDSNTKQTVIPLTGDMNIGNIIDVEYLQDLFFMGVQFPKPYASKEQGVTARATISQLDVQFARQVRRRQDGLKPGLRKIYEIEFTLQGIDPDAFEWDVVFPELATMDEVMKWEIEKVKAEVAKTYMKDIGALNDEWLFREILDFTEDQVKDYAQEMEPPGGEGGLELPTELARRVKSDPTLRWILNDIKDIVASKQARDEIVAGKRAVGIKK